MIIGSTELSTAKVCQYKITLEMGQKKEGLKHQDERINITTIFSFSGSTLWIPL